MLNLQPLLLKRSTTFTKMKQAITPESPYYGAVVCRLFQTCSWLWQTAPLPVGYFSARVIADIVYYGFWREKRRNVLRNTRKVLGREASSAAVRRVARRSVQNYFCYMVDFLRFPRLTQEQVLASIETKHWQTIDDLLATKQGVIVVGLHMGNWDLAGAAAGLRGYPFNVVVEPFKPAALDEYIQGTRRLAGMRTMPMEQAARGSLKALRNGEMVGLLIDRPMPGAGIPVRFFDAITEVPGGAATLAVRTGAKVLPSALIRRGSDRFELVVDSSIETPRAGDTASNIRALTQAIMTSLEQVVRENPDQWYMFRRFWPPVDRFLAHSHNHDHE